MKGKLNNIESILSRCEYVTESGCLIWTGMLTDKGYGRVDFNGKRHLAHLLVWKFTVGDVPIGLVLDHLCRVRCCVNVNHLEPVTHRINILRGIGSGALHAKKTACVNGHPFSDENTFVSSRERRRRCLTCQREIEQARKPRKRTKPIWVVPEPAKVSA